MDNLFVDIHTHQNACQSVTLRAAGVHPWDAAGLSEDDLRAAIEELWAADVEAIGEAGLDYAVATDKGAQEWQETVFRAQLEVAAERGLPVVLHCVRAFEPVMSILADYELRAVVFHGFVGSPEQALRAVGNGYFLSFGMRSFASPRTVEAIRRHAPPDHIFLETDDDPAPIAEVYARAAGILGVPVAELVRQIFSNFAEVRQPEAAPRGGLINHPTADFGLHKTHDR